MSHLVYRYNYIYIYIYSPFLMTFLNKKSILTLDLRIRVNFLSFGAICILITLVFIVLSHTEFFHNKKLLLYLPASLLGSFCLQFIEEIGWTHEFLTNFPILKIMQHHFYNFTTIMIHIFTYRLVFPWEIMITCIVK